MKGKLVLSVLSSLVLMNQNEMNLGSTFTYQYQIKTNSYSPLDDAAGYYYKEQMIDKFEYELFTLDEEDHTQYIINHLEVFKLSDDAKVSYQMGVICITLGQGNGNIIKGRFRKNECDEKVIREKYYILELFK